MARPKSNTRKTSAKGIKAGTRKAKAPKAQSGEEVIKMLKSTVDSKRPPNNPDMPQTIINTLNRTLNTLKEILDTYAQHLRSLDRKRLNGVGIKKMGFIDRAYELALENGEFLPHYLTLERFGKDIEYFMDFRSLSDLTNQIKEQLWNITIQSADIAYTDALEFYASVREAAKRRVDAAESIYAALSPFFKSMGKKHEGEEAEPTKKEELREFKGLQRGTHNGILVIENKKPKLIGGKHKFIDETFKDTAEFKESEDA